MNVIDSVSSKDASAQTIVLVEDDVRLATLIANYLESLGYQVISIYVGSEAPPCILDIQPALVILDYMLPEMDGFEICTALRPSYAGPILMLTASDDDLTEVSALNRGIDDFMTKPLRPHVLQARINALLRREPKQGAVDKITDGKHVCCRDLVLNKISRTVTLAKSELDLTDAEFDLLALLMDKPGQIFSRDALFILLRGIEYDGIDRSIDQRISTLRKKLVDADPPHRYIKSVRAKGYMLVPDD